MALVDSYSETNQSSSIGLYGFPDEPTCGGQSFTGDGKNLSSVKFYLKKDGAPDGNMTAYLYAHTGTFGTSSEPTGDALATSNSLVANDLTTDYQLIEFTFGTPYLLDNGTKYVIVLCCPDVSAANGVIMGIDNTSPTHGGNASYYVDSWASSSSWDVCFYVYGVEVPTTSTSSTSSSSSSTSSSSTSSTSSSSSSTSSTSSSSSLSSSSSSSSSSLSSSTSTTVMSLIRTANMSIKREKTQLKINKTI